MIILSIMTTAVENPVVLVVPDTVQDYVVRATPRVWCSQRVAGAFIAFIGLGIGVACGVTFGVYYRGC